MRDDRFDDFAVGVGLDPDSIPAGLRERLQTDAAFAYHVAVCASDPEMLSTILRPYLVKSKSTSSLAVSALSSYAGWLLDGARTVADGEYTSRIEACSACPHRVDVRSEGAVVHRLAATFGTTWTCGLCGCDVHRKARLPRETCPDLAFGRSGRWRGVDPG